MAASDSEQEKLKERSAESANCHGDPVCQKIIAENAGSVFKIHTDSIGGTGWLGPDGKVNTDFHVVSGAREITAETSDGKLYKLGKDIAIDDVHDAVSLGFVDAAPENVKRLEITDEKPGSAQTVTLLSHPRGEPLKISQGQYVGALPSALEMNGKPGSPESLSKWLAGAPESLRADLEQFVKRPLDLSRVQGDRGSSGAPLFDSQGRVYSVLDVTKGDGSQVIGGTPAGVFRDLLKQSPNERKFAITSGYEPGLSYYPHRFMQEDNLHRFFHAGLPVVGMAGLGRMALSPGASKVAALTGTAYLGYSVYTDTKELRHSTNWRDTVHGSLSLAGDGLLAGGLTSKFLSRAGSLGVAALAAGAVLKVGAELVPNHYSIQEIKRKDGTNSPPVFSYLAEKNRH